MIWEYGKILLLGILKSPFIYVQGFLVYFLIKDRLKPGSRNISWQWFLIASTIMAFLLYVVMRIPIRWVREIFPATPYIFFLYLIIFCLLYELVLLVERKFFTQKWDPIHFVLLFLSVTGIFYTTESFGSSFGRSVVFLLGQCIGLFIFTRVTLSLYFHFVKRYHGPNLLKNPVVIVFLAFFIGELVFLLSSLSS